MPARASTLFTLGLGLLSALAAFPAAAEDPIRITQLKRCGDLFAEDFKLRAFATVHARGR